jgi:hypothetical protein
MKMKQWKNHPSLRSEEIEEPSLLFEAHRKQSLKESVMRALVIYTEIANLQPQRRIIGVGYSCRYRYYTGMRSFLCVQIVLTTEYALVCRKQRRYLIVKKQLWTGLNQGPK